MDLRGLKQRLAHLARAVPQPEAAAWSSESIELSLAAGLVWRELECWASTRPGFVPMPAPTIPHDPDEGDRRMAAQCPQLAALAEARLIHTPDVLPARLGALYARYTASGEHDEGIDAALADVDSRLAEILASGVPVPDWCAAWLIPLQRISAGNSAGG